MNVKDCKIGMKVRFIAEAYTSNYSCFPKDGTVGRIVDFGSNVVLVEWPKGTVKARPNGKYEWIVNFDMIEPFDRIEKDESPAIWEMLKPKMAKNQFIHNGEYISEEVKKMVELAYTCGYRRAKKGKPFMYAKKNNKGENQ